MFGMLSVSLLSKTMLKFGIVYMPPKSPLKPHWELKRYCTNCGGTKQYESVDHGVNSNGPYQDAYAFDCTKCDERGEVILDEIPLNQYENYDEILADYPNLTSITQYLQENKS